LKGALDVGLWTIIFVFLFVDLFDTSGTLIAVTQRAGLTKSDGKVPRLKQALLADSTATVAGATAARNSVNVIFFDPADVALTSITGIRSVLATLAAVSAVKFDIFPIV
jgi:AGZA family xanthine/uracil permease-like MFS transporter